MIRGLQGRMSTPSGGWDGEEYGKKIKEKRKKIQGSYKILVEGHKNKIPEVLQK